MALGQRSSHKQFVCASCGCNSDTIWHPWYDNSWHQKHCPCQCHTAANTYVILKEVKEVE